MDYRIAQLNDLDLLAEWNQQLIQDQQHRNAMSIPELRERMQGWLFSGEYEAAIFLDDAKPVAYALYRNGETEIHLRQFFVARDHRRKGIGKRAIRTLQNEVWDKGKRLTVDVLKDNPAAVAFWRAVGYKDYCLTLEILPETD